MRVLIYLLSFPIGAKLMWVKGLHAKRRDPSKSLRHRWEGNSELEVAKLETAHGSKRRRQLFNEDNKYITTTEYIYFSWRSFWCLFMRRKTLERKITKEAGERRLGLSPSACWIPSNYNILLGGENYCSTKVPGKRHEESFIFISNIPKGVLLTPFYASFPTRRYVFIYFLIQVIPPPPTNRYRWLGIESVLSWSVRVDQNGMVI